MQSICTPSSSIFNPPCFVTKAAELLQAVKTLIEKADDLEAAIAGVTDQFEDEVSSLSAAATAAEQIAKAVEGLA